MKNASYEKIDPTIAKIMGYEWDYCVEGGTLHFAHTFEEMVAECNKMKWKLTYCLNQPLEVVFEED